jgi:serine/threonine-protein kinase
MVVAARSSAFGGMVAIKVLRPSARVAPEVVERFTFAARAGMRIRSEHALRIFEVGTSPERGPYAAMELLEGMDLTELIKRTGHLRVDQAVQYVIEACEALAAAHACGVVHFDIRPRNLWVTTDAEGQKRLKVLDVGTSGTALRRPAVRQGTGAYLSPEQLRQAPDVDHRTDIWSLGVVLYLCVTKQLPFEGASVSAVRNAVMDLDPVKMARRAPRVPVGLQRVVDRCLQKDPALRYADVGELARELMPLTLGPASHSANRAMAVVHAAATGAPAATHASARRRLLFRRLLLGAAGLLVLTLVSAAIAILLLPHVVK